MTRRITDPYNEVARAFSRAVLVWIVLPIVVFVAAAVAGAVWWVT